MSTEIELLEWLESQLINSLTDEPSVFLLIDRHISYQRISCPNDSIYEMIDLRFRNTPQISIDGYFKICTIISSLLKDESKPLDFRLSLLHCSRGADDKRIYSSAIELYFMTWLDLPSTKLISILYDLEKFEFPKIEWKFDSPEQFANFHNAAFEKLQDDKFHRRNSFLVNELFESFIPIYG